MSGSVPDNEKVGVQGASAAGPGPVAAQLMGRQEERADPTIARGQEGLVVGPFGQVGVDPDAGLAWSA